MAERATEVLKVEAAKDGNSITMKLFSDGAISLSSDSAENFIYLYPEQIGVLKVLLNGGWQAASLSNSGAK